MNNYECSFKELKTYLGKAVILSKPLQGETLIVYLAVLQAAVSAILLRVEAIMEMLVFYASRVLLDRDTRYPYMEKIVLALVVAARNIRPFFQAHYIFIYTKPRFGRFYKILSVREGWLSGQLSLASLTSNTNPRHRLRGMW